MITVSGTVFSVEPEDVEVPAIVDGESTTVSVRGTGIQIISASGSTLKISTKTHVDMVRSEFLAGDHVSITIAKV